MEKLLQKLKETALTFQIDPLNSIGHAAKLNTVIKVLSDINKSYYNFLEIEFLKNPDFKKEYNKNSKILDTFKESLDLLVVDVKFGSYETSVAPNLAEVQSPIFKNEVLQWKKEAFSDYKNIVVLGDYNNSSYTQKLVKRYNEEERAKIFQPLFSSIGDGKNYTLNIKSSTGVFTKTLRQPTKERVSLFIPKILVQKDEINDEKNYLVHAKLKNKGDGKNVSFNKSNIKTVHYMEELTHDTYPYKPNIIQFEKLVFFLKSKIDCSVSFEDNNYLIECSELDITVWGSTREEAEEAFAFSFYSLYKNFYLEADNKLSKDALSLKKKLKSLVKSVIENEGKKK